ncbi:hypothetical protein D3C75_934720 [compost metagenome]
MIGSASQSKPSSSRGDGHSASQAVAREGVQNNGGHRSATRHSCSSRGPLLRPSGWPGSTAWVCASTSTPHTRKVACSLANTSAPSAVCFTVPAKGACIGVPAGTCNSICKAQVSGSCGLSMWVRDRRYWPCREVAWPVFPACSPSKA